MNPCPLCNIRVGGSAAYCPLCKNRLSGPDDAPWWPKITPRVRRFGMLFKIVAFLLLATNVVAGAIDFLLVEEPHRHESLLMLVWVIAILLVLRILLRRRYN